MSINTTRLRDVVAHIADQTRVLHLRIRRIVVVGHFHSTRRPCPHRIGAVSQKRCRDRSVGLVHPIVISRQCQRRTGRPRRDRHRVRRSRHTEIADNCDRNVHIQIRGRRRRRRHREGHVISLSDLRDEPGNEIRRWARRDRHLRQRIVVVGHRHRRGARHGGHRVARAAVDRRGHRAFGLVDRVVHSGDGERRGAGGRHGHRPGAGLDAEIALRRHRHVHRQRRRRFRDRCHREGHIAALGHIAAGGDADLGRIVVGHGHGGRRL